MGEGGPSCDCKKTSLAPINDCYLKMNFPWIILGLVTLIRLVLAAGGHLSEVESYLLLCSHHLDWGFVEGPAGVPALMRLSEIFFGYAPLAIRFLSPLFLLGSSWILWCWVAQLCNRRIAYWTVIVFNLLPLANAAGVVMEGTIIVTLCWFAALAVGWKLITNQVEKNKISLWLLFGFILALGTQVTYQVGWLLPLVAIASWSCFQNEIADENKATVFSGWRKFFGILAAILLLALSWLPIILWNQNHDWLQFQNMTWDSFWSWPPFVTLYFQQLPTAWCLLVFVPFVIAGACCFSGIWNIENPFFLITVIPCFFCVNELGHGKVSFALILVMTGLFLPIAIELLLKIKQRMIVALLLLLVLTCSSLLLLFGKISSSTSQESPWDFPSATGVVGAETAAKQLLQLRITYGDTSGRLPFLIAETPGLAAILGAVLPIHYPELQNAPSVFMSESPALTSQLQYWPNYADATTGNKTPDPLYTEEKEVSPFLGYDAFYITTEKLEEIPQTITGAFSAIIPLSVILSLQNNGQEEELKIYLCQKYQMLSL